MIKHSQKKQQGVSLVIAVFIILIVSMLGAAMITVLSQGSELVARDVLSTRALFAAESGAERMLNQVYSVPDDCSANPVNNWTFNGGADAAGLISCRSMASCTSELVNGIRIFTINSDGECGSADVIAHRVVTVRAVE